MALELKKLLRALSVTQAAIANHCGVSEATIAQLVNHGKWPREPMRGELKASIERFLSGKKLLPGVIGTAFEVAAQEVALPGGTPVEPDHSNDQSQEDNDMLLRKQTLSPAAKKHWGILRDPFGELQSQDDMWISPDIRYVREHMYTTAKHGGFLAVVGESGSGKSSVRRDLEQRIADEHLPIILVQPYVLAAEDTDKKGKTLKSTHIAEAILATCSPLERPRMSSEARFAQVHRVLKDQHKSGQRVCVVIEEAHSLPIPTLKHLKRLYELESGYTKLLSIILIGQPELLIKLSERNPEVREIVQRCEVVELLPIAHADIESFLNHRLQRVGKTANQVIDAAGINALSNRLVSRDHQSQLYPLAVSNFMVRALNLAADIGSPVIDAEIIAEVV